MTRTRRFLAPLGCVCALLGALAAAGGAQGAARSPTSAGVGATGPTGTTGATTTQALTATLSDCHTDPVTANRYAIFASQTVAADVPDTVVMSVDFELEERSTASGPFAPVTATGFGDWVTSQPRVGVFTYNHEVTALPAPAAFRVLVRARWIGRHRRVLHAAMALSPVCLQPLLEPDLVIGRVTRSASSTPGTAQYTVEVRNDGNTAAGPFQVALTAGATALAPATIPGLAAGASQDAVFVGRVCTAGATLTVVADPAGSVAEPADPRRTRTLGCPIP